MTGRKYMFLYEDDAGNFAFESFDSCKKDGKI